MRLLSLLAALLILAGCGYRPSSHYTRHTLGNSIYTEINIPIEDPESSILIIDAINEAVVSKFKARLASKEEADTHLLINSATFATAGLQKDERGYTVLYRTTATLSIKVTTKTAKKSFNVSGIYDFAVTADSVVSEEKRLASFKLATIKALDAVTPVLASMGATELDKSTKEEMQKTPVPDFPGALIADDRNLTNTNASGSLPVVDPDDLPLKGDSNGSRDSNVSLQ
jgi:hypothetical protein